MERGKVKWFSLDKGYGFIEPEDGSKDVFVHRSNVENPDRTDGLREGEEVEYDVEETPRGLSAENVRRVDEAGGY